MKKKLKDLTVEEYRTWGKNCDEVFGNCHNCPFQNVYCETSDDSCWIYHKEDYSNEFLNQEIEIINKKAKLFITIFEKTILEYLESRYKYIARDESGALYIYENKPSKGDDKYYVEYGYYDKLVFDDLFNFIKWEDDEPTLIKDLLKED